MGTKSTGVGIDLETSGLPSTDKRGNLDFSKVCILRIGGWYQAEGAEPQVFDRIIRPCPGYPIDEKALAVNGLTAERLFEGENIHDGLDAFDMWLSYGLERAHARVIGHNLLRFDVQLLRAWTRLTGTFSGGWCTYALDSCVDTLALWRAWACDLRREDTEHDWEFMRRASRHNSDARCSMDYVLQTLFGKDMVRTGPHSPSEDARLAVLIYQEMDRRGILDFVLNREEGQK
jgi:DNA polymerase III epsilon subunit-like protein